MSLRPRAAHVLALVTAGLLTLGVLQATAAPAAPASSEDGGRTWVVDAIDDGQGNRWESVETGTSELTVTVGDTVEWQFDRAAIDHDLVSEDTRATWAPPLEEYRVPGGEPVRRTFTQPGTYLYLCSLHGTLMRGVVIVEEPGANRPPVVTTTVEPRTGPAPLDVHATALATDPDGDPLTYRWDFGTTEDASDLATTAHAMYRYETPGARTATLEVSDGRGGVVTEEFAITVGGPSSVVATATPSAGTAPLTVGFSGGAEGGAPSYAWDFGDGETGTGSSPEHVYAEPGTYTAVLTATAGGEELGTDTVAITVADTLPDVVASATPTSGVGPLDVTFSTAVTTTGTFAPYADGTATYPDLTGDAVLVRRRGETTASLDVTGLAHGASHLVHVHEEACSSAKNGGAHFRFDEAQPFAEANEIWLPFTSDGAGASGLVAKTRPLRAGPKAVSIVIHDPVNPAQRIGCADLGPATADLGYAWDFGDGTTGEGPDPDHTYDEPGTYTATVTVGSVHAGHGMGLDDTVSSSVQVRVDDVVAPQTTIAAGPSGTVASGRAAFRLVSDEPATFGCRLDAAAWTACPALATFSGLRDGAHRLQVRAIDAAGNTDATPATRSWTVDTTGPAVRRTSLARTADRTPTLRASVSDRHSKVRRVVVRVDGRVALARYDARRGVVTATPGRRLPPGPHAVKVVAVDAVGNRSVTTWKVRVR